MTNNDPYKKFYQNTGFDINFEFATYNTRLNNNNNTQNNNNDYNIYTANNNVKWDKNSDSTFLQQPNNTETKFNYSNNDYSLNINSTGFLGNWNPKNYTNNSSNNTNNNSNNNSNNIIAKGNNNYSYEIDAKTGCITYKDCNGNKITVTEMRKHCPKMVETAIAKSKQIQKQNSQSA